MKEQSLFIKCMTAFIVVTLFVIAACSQIKNNEDKDKNVNYECYFYCKSLNEALNPGSK